MTEELMVLKANNVLKFLVQNLQKEFSVEELMTQNIFLISGIKELVAILDDFHSHGYVSKTFSAKILDIDSQGKTIYKITSAGISKWTEIQVQAESRAYAEIDYDNNQKERKKINRKWLIGFAIAFVVLIAVMIIVILSSG